MTLLTYQVFKTVADIGSFRKAADILGLTPSAISHAISSMESELGFSVLTRSKNGVTLTNYGEHLLPYVNAVLNSDESLQQFIAETNGLKAGKVKIGVFSSVCTNWLPQIMSSFEEKYPGVKIEVYQGSYDEVAFWLKNGIECGRHPDRALVQGSAFVRTAKEHEAKRRIYRDRRDEESFLCYTERMYRCRYPELLKGKQTDGTVKLSRGG